MQKEEMKIYAVVVLYNKNYKDSLTFQSIKEHTDTQIVLCDNSTKAYNNQDAEQDYQQVKYINMGGNQGLSKAYNRAIESISDFSAILCLFDDDTKIPAEYFDAVKKKFSESKADVLLPIVYDEVGLLSPSIIDGCRVTRAQNVEEVTSENITGINSGMAVRAALFQQYRYDERYFLDCVDHKFIRDMKKENREIAVLNIEIKQSFSNNEKSSLQVRMNRFKIYKKDFYEFCKENKGGKLYYFCYITFRWLSLHLK